MQWPSGDLRVAPPDDEHQLLALVEAQIGALVDVLPVALLVTSASGDVFRANSAAVDLLGPTETLVGQPVASMLRDRGLSVRVRILSYAGERVRLYVLQGPERRAAGQSAG